MAGGVPQGTVVPALSTQANPGTSEGGLCGESPEWEPCPVLSCPAPDSECEFIALVIDRAPQAFPPPFSEPQYPPVSALFFLMPLHPKSLFPTWSNSGSPRL